MRSHRTTALIVLLGSLHGSVLHPQRLTPGIHGRQPYLEHHEVPVLAGFAGTVGGSLLASYIVHASGADSSWEKAAPLFFTIPFAFLGTVAGAFAVPREGSYVIQPMIGGIVGGLLGGAIGRPVGRRAARGSRGARSGIRTMGVLSVPAALGIGFVFAVLGQER